MVLKIVIKLFSRLVVCVCKLFALVNIKTLYHCIHPLPFGIVDYILIIWPTEQEINTILS